MITKVVLALALLCAAAAAATVASNFSPLPSSIDDGTLTLTPSLTLTSASFGCSAQFQVVDVNVQVTFDKTDGSCNAPDDGDSFHDETSMSVASSGGATVALVSTGAYSGEDNISPGVTVTFDQAASSVVSGVPTSGTFRPVGNLDDFNEDVPGGTITYTMTVGDSTSSDPLCMFSWSVTAQAICTGAPPPPNTGSICSGISPVFADEGVFNDLTSTAPAGYRVNIHSFLFRCADSATVTSEYYFKSGPSAGFEEIRWPWVLHFQETYACVSGAFHLYEPVPLVIGEQTVGYLTAVDNNDDISLASGNSPFGDAFLTITPGRILTTGQPFSSGSTAAFSETADVCFRYSLDQFGGLARTRHGFHVRGFDGASLRLPASSLADGSYTLLDHTSLRLSARLMASGRGGAATITEASLRLADGHRFRLAAEAEGGAEALLLEVVLPSGDVQALHLDGAMASRLDALDLSFGEEAEASIRTQVFASSFASRAACLQDPLLARYYDLGDLEELDDATTYASARVTLTSEAFEVTLVAIVEEEASAAAASLKVLSHRRIHVGGSDRDVTDTLAREDDAGQGLLGVTAQAGWHAAMALSAEAHLEIEETARS